ncbi:TdeIII family type II restriction endonuclease [Bacillus megaterium]|nr:TdeIII family type II restriction endonuclease [Priestia megaterium]
MEEIKTVLKEWYENKKANLNDIKDINRSAFEETLFKAFFPGENYKEGKKVYKMMHSLNTSAGNLVEKIAHNVSKGYKLKGKNSGLYITEKQNNEIAQIISELDSKVIVPNPYLAKSIGLNLVNKNKSIISIEGDIDLYMERGNNIFIFELKSNRPNSSEAKMTKQRLLQRAVALQNMYPEKDVQTFIAFATTSETSKEIFQKHLIEFKKYFSESEILLGDEFWEYISNGSLNIQIIKSMLLAVAKDSLSKD